MGRRARSAIADVAEVVAALARPIGKLYMPGFFSKKTVEPLGKESPAQKQLAQRGEGRCPYKEPNAMFTKRPALVQNPHGISVTFECDRRVGVKEICRLVTFDDAQSFVGEFSSCRAFIFNFNWPNSRTNSLQWLHLHSWRSSPQ